MKMIYASIFSLLSLVDISSDTIISDSIVVLDTVSTDINFDEYYENLSPEGIARGEEIYYAVNYGWFTVGKAWIKVQKNNYRINYRDCYKVDIYGKTSGLVDWVAKVDDHWGAYIDTSALVTHIAYRNIKEGRYRRNEITRFDHITDNIEVKILNQKTKDYFEPMYYQSSDNMRDMIGGFYYLRALDYSGMHKGDTVKVSGFFEDTFYDMEILYEGKDVVKTKMGKVNSIKLVPVMPDNSLFDGENSVTVWLSDDENKIPVKIDADMFIGHAGVEVTEVKNLKKKLNVKSEEGN